MRKHILATLAVTGCLILYVVGCCVVMAGQESAKPAGAAYDVSGTYTSLREGEFVQLTVDDGKLSGYISRFGDTESDKGQFIDQFFDKTSLVGDRLTFNTKIVHGVWYVFNGRVTITPGKQLDSEGYRVMKGTLVQHSADEKSSDKPMQRQVEFKSFPSDMGKP
jgi:hypothetical protein